MKRIYVAAATAVLVGNLPVPFDHEHDTCKKPPCAAAQNATMPEPSHAPEDVPGYKPASDEVWLMNHSPIISAKIGSELHIEYLEWLSENGLSIEGLA